MIRKRSGIVTMPLFLSICLLPAFTAVHAQIKWPAATQQAKPWTRWWWEGSAVDAPGLRYNLQAYKEAGLGGVEITPIYGVKGAESNFLPFLSKGWLNMLDSTLAIARSLNMGVDLANATGWPFGGPWINEQDAAKTLMHQQWEVKGGTDFSQSVLMSREAFIRSANPQPIDPAQVKKPVQANNNLQALALDQVVYAETLKPVALVAYGSKGTVLKIDTLGKTSELKWRTPSGEDWKIIAIYSAMHGKMVERAAPGGEGYAIDHFSKQAADKYFARFDEAFKGRQLKDLRAFFNDSYEVDDARGQSNWTPQMLQEFHKRRGYDLLGELPALLGQGSPDLVNRVVYDYRSTIDELILENFTQTWKKWSAGYKAQVRNQSHGSPANTLDLYGAVDIPETEGNNIQRFKFATSAAHVTGKPLVSSESCTWLNEHFKSSWGDVKKAIDLYFLGGVNHIFYHGTAYSPKSAPWPGWLFYAAVHFQPVNPQWKDFSTLNQYITRVQSFLQQGDADNDILLYYPIEDRYMQPGKELLQHFDGMEKNFEGTDFEHVAHWMQEEGYSYDFFSSRQLEKFRVFNGRVVSGGHAYRAILLPANKYITVAAMSKLRSLASQGARIMFYKSAPSSVPGLKAGALDTLKMPPGVFGKGMVYSSDDLGKLMQWAAARKDGVQSDSIQTVRRRNGDGYTYFVSNRSSQNYVLKELAFEAKPVSVAVFDPMTGNMGLAKWRLDEKGAARVTVNLAPWQSLVIRTYDRKQTGEGFRYLKPTGETRTLTGSWKVSFDAGGPVLPSSFNLSSPAYWSSQAGESYKNFAGTASYTLAFELANPRSAGYYRLQLPAVHETAEVWLNGKKLCTMVGPDFSYDFPSTMLNAKNEIRIQVSSLMANRIRYMDQKNLPWKIFYNTNMPARLKENSVNGLFSAAAWPVMDSGMEGQVKLGGLSVVSVQ